MRDLHRKVPRFNINFKLSSNNLEGKGINISQKGLAFLTTDEIIPADDIPFDLEIKGYIFSDKIYTIKGMGRLLYSTKSRSDSAYYHNGFEFISLEAGSRDSIFELFEDIRNYEKNIKSGSSNKTLADFLYYPSTDIFQKAEIFSEASENMIDKKYEMFTYYLESGSKSSSDFVQNKTKKSKTMIMMGSNNYLGLTTHPDVIKAGKDALDKYGSGNGSGVMVGGKLSIHKELEEKLADFIGKEKVMLFNSGYAANVGIISGIARPNDAIINDQLNHASIFDGCKLSGAKSFIFSHNNMDSLERLLKRAKLNYFGNLIVVDGVYSSNGNLAPLDEIIKIASRYNCRIMVDEAHGFGVLGEKGIGACEHFNAIDKIDIIMGTMSKSLAGVGGFAAASKDVIDYLKFFARSYIFSTGVSPATAGCIIKSLEIIKNDKSIRESLWNNINYFKNGLVKLNLNIGETKGAIVPIYIPDMETISIISKKLMDKGLYHNVFSYPAVPLGGSLLRFGVMATHTETELKKALEIIEESFSEEGLLTN